MILSGLLLSNYMQAGSENPSKKDRGVFVELNEALKVIIFDGGQ